jgi:hypothetical protein
LDEQEFAVLGSSIRNEMGCSRPDLMTLSDFEFEPIVGVASLDLARPATQNSDQSIRYGDAME